MRQRCALLCQSHGLTAIFVRLPSIRLARRGWCIRGLEGVRDFQPFFFRDARFHDRRTQAAEGGRTKDELPNDPLGEIVAYNVMECTGSEPGEARTHCGPGTRLLLAQRSDRASTRDGKNALSAAPFRQCN